MPPKVRTVADAVEYIEDVARALDVHIREQRVQDQEFDKRIVELEKSDIRAEGKLDTILATLERNRNNWQVWVGFGATNILTLCGLLYMVFGGNK